MLPVGDGFLEEPEEDYDDEEFIEGEYVPNPKEREREIKYYIG